MIVSLTGFMGCGKSTVGRLLAKELGWDFVDLDIYISHKIGRTPQQIISDRGEEYFRTVEAEAVKDIFALNEVDGRNVVLALGGGTPTIPSIQHLVFSDKSRCIYLKASEKTIAAHVRPDSGRPLFDDGWKDRLSAREPVYERAGIIVSVDGRDAKEIAVALSRHFC